MNRIIKSYDTNIIKSRNLQLRQNDSAKEKGKLMLRKTVQLLMLLIVLSSCQSETKAKIEINEKTYTVEVANSQEKRAKGLMFRKHLPGNTGMLFVFSYEDYRYFYMKNTLIPLDIAFFNAQMEIVSIKQMEPLDEATVPSDKKAMYALEMNRGFFEKEGIKIGDKIKLLTSVKYLP